MRRKHRATPRARPCADTEEDFGVMMPYAKECQEAPEPGRGKDSPPEPYRACILDDTLMSDFWSPEL